MKCVVCGKELETTDRRVHYCSDECRKKAMKSQMVSANRKRRDNDPEYCKKTYARNLARYYEKKKEQYTAIAVELNKHCGDIDAMVAVLEERTKLRH